MQDYGCWTGMANGWARDRRIRSPAVPALTTMMSAWIYDISQLSEPITQFTTSNDVVGIYFILSFRERQSSLSAVTRLSQGPGCYIYMLSETLYNIHLSIQL